MGMALHLSLYRRRTRRRGDIVRTGRDDPVDAREHALHERRIDNTQIPLTHDIALIGHDRYAALDPTSRLRFHPTDKGTGDGQCPVFPLTSSRNIARLIGAEENRRQARGKIIAAHPLIVSTCVCRSRLVTSTLTA